MSKINLTEKEKLMLDYEITNISITVHEPSGDVVSPLILRLADNRKFYLDKNQNRVELCGDIYDVNTGGNPDELGGSCANAMQTKDCDRDALIAKLQAILEAVDELEVNTENINLNAEQINLSTDEVEQLLEDIKALLTAQDYTAVLALIEEHTLQSNDNETTIIAKLQELIDETHSHLLVTAPILNCVDNGGVKSNVYVRQSIVWDIEASVELSNVTQYSTDGVNFTATAPTGTITLGACVIPAACKENKTYQIKGIKTITFDPNKIYGYKAGVWNKSNPTTPMTGKASLEEGAGVVAEYGFGDSFGNGDEVNLMPIAVIIKGLDADADIRISVIQECGYTPTIV
jgi:hypothetical protein